MNDPPVVFNQSYTINEDQTMFANAYFGLLRGSYDVDNDTLVVLNTTKPSNGNLTVQANGSFTYVPSANFNGFDGFSFWVSDSHGGIVGAVVNITIGKLQGTDSRSLHTSICMYT